MNIRRSTHADVDTILGIYESAKRYMRANGNFEQWNGPYPSAEVILNDIAGGNHYMAFDDDGQLLVVFALIFGEDPTYRVVEGGQWLNDKPYATIHRIASAGLRGGMVDAAVAYAFERVDNVRIDTHADNCPMLDALGRLGFSHIGVIRLADGSPREAFHIEKGSAACGTPR